MRMYCITASVISAILMLAAVFLGNVGHSEYKSQMRKRKINKIAEIILDDNYTLTGDRNV